MHVARLSLTPLKGASHEHPDRLALDADGPRHDRLFALVDLARARVLRTVENPSLVACRASYDGTRLGVWLPDGVRASALVDAGASITVDYWGRPAALRVVEGPWSEVFSAYLGYDVVLAQVERPGQVVFGGPVALLTTSSLREVANRLGRVLDRHALLADSERFRSTVVVDTGDAQAFVEDAWHEVSLGSAMVRVRGAVPRCAVTRITPGVGSIEGADPLRALARDRTEVKVRGREVVFGVDADVVVPGVVGVGDAVDAV